MLTKKKVFNNRTEKKNRNTEIILQIYTKMLLYDSREVENS